MINFKKICCVLCTTAVTLGIVYLLATNLVWYYALLGYFGVGVAMFTLIGLYEILDKKRNPWRPYHEGTMFDWWPIVLPVTMIIWFYLLYMMFEDIFDCA